MGCDVMRSSAFNVALGFRIESYQYSLNLRLLLVCRQSDVRRNQEYLGECRSESGGRGKVSLKPDVLTCPWLATQFIQLVFHLALLHLIQTPTISLSHAF